MSETTAVPVIVLSRHEDNAEAINRVLRNSGRAAHVLRLDDAGDLAEHLGNEPCELLVVFADESDNLLITAAAVVDAAGVDLPLISCHEILDEDVIAVDIAGGAQDAVTLRRPDRLVAVLERALRLGRLDRALRGAISSASSYREQLRRVVAGTADSIAHIGEGIVLDANRAWAQLFGFEVEDEMPGLTFMDLFQPEHQPAIKGALVACAQGRWPPQGIKATGVTRHDKPISVLLELEPASFDEEPCVRVRIAARAEVDDEALADRLHAALRLDPGTGLFGRLHFLKRLETRINEEASAGVQALVLFALDDLPNVQRQVGARGLDIVLAGLADLLRDSVQSRDLYGRLGTAEFGALVARGTRRDLKAWGQSVIAKVARTMFEAGGRSVSLSISAGIALVDRRGMDIDVLYAAAAEALDRVTETGPGQVGMSSHEEDSTKMEELDQLWVKRIKRALLDNRFRLADQPIASLTGETQDLHDLFVRMIDEQGDEVLPTQFMQAAERNRLIKNIDRWVIGAAISFCLSHPKSKVFVRLSKDTMLDSMLPAWLETCRKNTGLPEGVIIFQVAEDVAANHLKQTREMAIKLRNIGFGFALEGFTASPAATKMLDHLPVDFLKIDGALMQGLAADEPLQERVKAIVQQARDHEIKTIAERVEDANTMAVLWQIGVHYIQGYQIREPEVVLAED
ncbi:MAG TPA: EAL domain-containing protein [Gammaproteobacteria bacterium]|nr:EAL domain-containing protein [Gammaproteobacteria bacterium]